MTGGSSCSPQTSRSAEAWRFAIDAERRGQAPPSHLARSRHFSSGSDFWRSWTQFEVACKLHDRPVAHALSMDAGELHAGISLCSFDLEDLAVSVGFLLEPRYMRTSSVRT
ncbi:MAG: hypothetical protein U5Q16_04860 [Gammaproteobacteria bacterium]|nr:hypothetical protein [Gammaproteobacteria bacterium]